MLKQEKYSDAKSDFKLNLELFPNSANVHDSYAEVLIKLKDYEQAEIALLKGLKLANKEVNNSLIISLSDQLKKLYNTQNKASSQNGL